MTTDREVFPLQEAIEKAVAAAKAKFSESVDISLHLGINPKQSTQNVRGVSQLPHGTGKTVKIAVFAEGEQAQAAEAAGADRVGSEDLLKDMKQGAIDYDVVIASPDMMRLVGQLGPILGPRNLMPNPKVGTVSADVGAAVSRAKAGQVTFRNDKAGIIHCRIGNVTFKAADLAENLMQVVRDVVRLKPSDAKGTYLKKLYLNTTMGASAYKVDLTTIEL